MKLTKNDILRIPHLSALGFEEGNFIINGVSTDSRTIKPKDMFIALVGSKYDGHDFVSKAVDAGASAIVVEHKWAKLNGEMLNSIHVPKIIVENSTLALGQLALQIRKKYKIPFIAVGGSNGKTTTKEMIAQILATKYNVLKTEGNQNNQIGVPRTLFNLNAKHEVGVIEVGTNHPGEINYLCSIILPTHGIITNIGREHLEFFHSLKGVSKAEGELFEWIITNNGLLFVNFDDKYIKSLSLKARKKVTYGINARKVDIKGRILSINGNAHPLIKIMPKGKKAFEVVVRVPGLHNAQNALAAIAVGTIMKVPTSNIQRALSLFQPPENRMQVKQIAGVTVINDSYNANPDSMLASLATIKRMKSTGRKIAVLADMLELGDKEREMHALIGKSISRSKIDILLTYGTLARIIHDSSFPKEKMHFESKESLVLYLASNLRRGDIVLIKGSHGMRMDEVASSLINKLMQEAKG